eukprot:403368571
MEAQLEQKLVLEDQEAKTEITLEQSNQEEIKQEVVEEEESEIMKYNKTRPQSYLLMFNVQKQKNFGTLIRSAAAFNVKQVFIIDSQPTKKRLSCFGSQGTATKTNFQYFGGLKDVKQFCTERSISICGIEIMPEAQPIHAHPFKGDTLFMLGNEGSGLNKNQIAICDQFIYIPQYTDKTASLNVAIAGSIIFQHFAQWAGYQEQKIVGYKFEEGDAQSRQKGSLIATVGFAALNDPVKKREQREQRKNQDNDEVLDGGLDFE